jgi:hypothetical protein
MSSLSAKDRVSLCSFTFSDGRRCRTPRTGKHPRFCFDHAQKEARARTAQKLGKDLTYFFSGDYLSACDLSTALTRLIPAVVRGDVKPKTARTVAYLVQTLMQAIHISQHEYINAFGTDGWRNSVRNSVNGNHDYLFPPDPEPQQPESPQPQPQPSQPQTQAQQPASVPPSNPPQPAAVAHPASVAHPFRGEALRSLIPTQALPTLAPSPSPTSAPSPQTPVAHAASTIDKTHPIPATQFPRPVVPAAQPDKPPQTGPSPPQPSPNRDAYALHFDHSCRLLIDGKPL